MKEPFLKKGGNVTTVIVQKEAFIERIDEEDDKIFINCKLMHTTYEIEWKRFLELAKSVAKGVGTRLTLIFTVDRTGWHITAIKQ